MRFDDIGSFPHGRIEGMRREEYLSLVRSIMEMKISAGVQVPTYPQLRDMIGMFMDPMRSPETTDGPYLIRRDAAEIMELDALKSIGRNIRVCVTGPLELYVSEFGSTNYEDLLINMAESVSRFIERAIEKARQLGIDVAVISIDEPSLGISSSIVFSEDVIIEALEVAIRGCAGRVDVQVHLHSPVHAELCARVSGINVIGVESASHPDYLDIIDRKALAENDTFIRAGIARTDILSMVARLNEQLNTNLWEQPDRLEAEILRMESPEVIRRRLERAVRIFGDLVRYAGPDCGLGSWPSQHLAAELLRNCARAIETFRGETS
ncbi:MAG: methionine synthase [Methanothrix sp.]|jgi:5-methyltetrahydropteroyltriglutamate--homocysteine methyltransferase|uniref:methionine synthase n=1 Tax=Methanothrix sp. TaxID=90426 RepID=UPI00247B3517|nr:methionine synthase [Methanothrix sp.]